MNYAARDRCRHGRTALEMIKQIGILSSSQRANKKRSSLIGSRPKRTNDRPTNAFPTHSGERKLGGKKQGEEEERGKEERKKEGREEEGRKRASFLPFSSSCFFSPTPNCFPSIPYPHHINSDFLLLGWFLRKEEMSKGRAHSSPELLQSDNPDSSNLDATVKLLLKIINDYHDACAIDDGTRKNQRIAGMIGILDDIRSRIEKSQSSTQKKSRREAELRRCNTDLRRNQLVAPTKEKRPQEPVYEENQRLRRELSVNLVARKSLERMFSSLGKEKEIIAAELARKVQELHGVEEHINDLKAQNEMLLEKVQHCAVEHAEKKKTTAINGGAVREYLMSSNSAALQERNRELSDQLLKSIDGYRCLQRKLKDAREENAGIRAKAEEMKEAVSAGLLRIHDLRRRVAERENASDIGLELSAVENMFMFFEEKVRISFADD
ncbi:hypothetical protein ACLOJK_021481 [Asimina triloba]